MMFCTASDVAAFLQIAIPDVSTHPVWRSIAEATAAIQNHCHQWLDLVEDDEITLDCAGGTRLFLPELPVVEVSKVVEDGKPLAGADYVLGQYGILHRIGRAWASGVQIVTITYTHGYALLPDAVVSVCVRAAARAYQAGLRAAELQGIPGLQGVTLGDYQASYASEQGAYREGMLGASGAPLLLRSEKEILSRYRV